MRDAVQAVFVRASGEVLRPMWVNEGGNVGIPVRTGGSHRKDIGSAFSIPGFSEAAFSILYRNEGETAVYAERGAGPFSPVRLPGWLAECSARELETWLPVLCRIEERLESYGLLTPSVPAVARDREVTWQLPAGCRAIALGGLETGAKHR